MLWDSGGVWLIRQQRNIYHLVLNVGLRKKYELLWVKEDVLVPIHSYHIMSMCCYTGNFRYRYANQF